MITEVPYYDVSRESRENDRRVISALYAIPKGSRVVLFLGGRKFVPTELLDHVARDYVLHLAFEFHGEQYVTSQAREYVHERLYGSQAG